MPSIGDRPGNFGQVILVYLTWPMLMHVLQCVAMKRNTSAAEEECLVLSSLNKNRTRWHLLRAHMQSTLSSQANTQCPARSAMYCVPRSTVS